MDRRQFMINSGRLLMLAGLAVVGGISVFKNRNAVQENCRFNNICKTCKELKNCNLPQSLEYK